MRLFLFVVLPCFFFSCGTEMVSDPPNNVRSPKNYSGDSVVKQVNNISKSDSDEIRELVEKYGLNESDTFEVGDVNGDGKKDRAIVMPMTMYYKDHKMDSQYVNIHFTCNIPDIRHDSGFNGLIADVGDLDGNKTDEIIYYPDWYQSNDAGIFVYGYKAGKWALFGSGSMRRDVLNREKDPIKFLQSTVRKINNSKFKISDYIWNDEAADMVDSAKTILIHK